MKLTAEATVLNDGKINTNINNAQDTADTAITKADNAQVTANTAVTKADSAQATANQAKTIADNTNQYFWFTSSGTDTGAHISEKTRAQFISSPSGGNLLIRSNGIAVRDGLEELATFGASTARIGKETGTNTNLVATSSGINFRSGTTQFGQLSAYDFTTLGTTMQNLSLVSQPSANSYGGIELSASSASGTGIPSEADLVAKKGSAEAGVYVTADQDSGGDHADVIILGQNIALQVGYGDDYISVTGSSGPPVATLDVLGNLEIAGNVIGDNVATDASDNFIPYSTYPFNTGTINAYQVGNLISVRYKLSNVGLNTSTTSALFSIYQNWRPKTENIFQASITDSNYTHIGTGVVRVQTDGWVYLRTPASMSQTTGLYVMFNGVYIH